MLGWGCGSGWVGRGGGCDVYADEAGWAGLRMLRAGNGRSFVLYSMPPSRSLRWTVPKCKIMRDPIPLPVLLEANSFPCLADDVSSKLDPPSLSDSPNHVFTRPSLIQFDGHLCGFFWSQQRWPYSFPCRRRSPPQAVTVPRQSRMNSECACSWFSSAPSTSSKLSAKRLMYFYFCAVCVAEWLANAGLLGSLIKAWQALGRACSGRRSCICKPSVRPTVHRR